MGTLQCVDYEVCLFYILHGTVCILIIRLTGTKAVTTFPLHTANAEMDVNAALFQESVCCSKSLQVHTGSVCISAGDKKGGRVPKAHCCQMDKELR